MPRNGTVASLLAGLLALTAGLVARPAQAQDVPTTWVFQCTYQGASDPYYWSPAFAVRTTAVHPPVEEVLTGWKAWLRGHVGRLSETDAYCTGTHEGNLPQVQQYITPRADLAVERAKWMPDFAVPYQLPREVYYYCSESEQGLQRRFVTDLFKAPMPANLGEYLHKAYGQHERWLYSQNQRPYSTNAGCSVAAPEPYQAYAKLLDAISVVTDPDRPFRLTRSAWPGVDPVAAPNLIDDLAARAKYAKLSIAPTRAQAKAAPPPPKPKVAGPPPKVPALTIKEDTSAKDAKAAWDEQVKKGLAAEAQKKVETAAKAAQQDAETKRKIAEFMAERRRQGNKQ